MMQAITTKYIGPTDVFGSRVKATSAAKSITLHWDDAMNSYDNHKHAAKTLATMLEWNYGKWISGVTKDGHIIWVCDMEIKADEFMVEEAK